MALEIVKKPLKWIVIDLSNLSMNSSDACLLVRSIVSIPHPFRCLPFVLVRLLTSHYLQGQVEDWIE